MPSRVAQREAQAPSLRVLILRSRSVRHWFSARPTKIMEPAASVSCAL